MGDNSLQHYNLYTHLFLCLKPWRFPQQRQHNGKNWRKFRRGTWRKSEVRKRWSMKQGRRAEKFILPYWWTSVIWRVPNWIQSTKNKGRVVLRGDIVEDDSGSYAVFTEQGSSASQMTAATVMDIISRLPGCAGQAADAVSAQDPSQNGRCSKIVENFKIGMSRHMDSSTTSHMAKIMVQYGRSSRSSWKESVRSSFGRTLMGKAIWENPFEIRLGEGFSIGNAYSYTVKKDYSYQCMWMTSNWLERNKILNRCGKC